MNLSLPKYYNNKIVKAIAEFDMINDNDKIAVAISGGKDSLFLLYALRVLKKYLDIDYYLSAFTIDLGFKDSDYTYLINFCDDLNIKYDIIETRIADYILDNKENNPCAKCSYFRKGAMVDYLKSEGIGTVAYGHHYDDAVVTFLMSIIYSAQIKTFMPKQYLSRNEIYIIRPLIYLREKKIKEIVKKIDLKTVLNPCPYDGKTKRAEIEKKLVGVARDKQIFYNIAKAMREGSVIEQWPGEADYFDLEKKIKELWGK